MKKKKVLITISLVTILLLSVFIFNYINEDREVIASGKENSILESDGMFSFMLETSLGSGEYTVSSDTKWPGSGYQYNERLSGCENGSTLIWNDEAKSVTLKANKSDKCYLYFDIVPPDVTLAATNADTSHGAAPATLSCNGATSSYNQKYRRVEISQINNKYTNCTLTYQTPSSKNYLNNYIIGLAGTTQGTGEVIDEKLTIFTNFSQNEYNNYSTYYGSKFVTGGTNVSNVFSFNPSTNMWETNPQNMSSNLYYHLKYSVLENGYYRVCAYSLDNSGAGSIKLSYRDSGTASTYSNIKTSICRNTEYITTGGTLYFVQITNADDNSIGKYGFTIQKIDNNGKSTGIRYEGKDPNNYIWFNNELWRIIGVFDENSHGQSGQNLVKIIRNDSIGGLAWHKSNTNDWTASSLMNLLNGAYLNSENGTGGEYCYGYSTTVGAQCDYTETGINDTYRAMIENVTWYLGGYSSYSATTGAFYGYERGTTVYSGRPTTWEEQIGLMYPSDYGYSVLASSCSRATNLGSYSNATCAGQSWLYGQGYEWTITPRSSSSDGVFHVNRSGDLDNSSARSGLSARPVLYLDSSVYVIDGTGMQSDPYIIGM